MLVPAARASTRSQPQGQLRRRDRHAAVHALEHPARTRVDFDGDGHVDLHGSPADVIGSVAHYLAAVRLAARPADALRRRRRRSRLRDRAAAAGARHRAELHRRRSSPNAARVLDEAGRGHDGKLALVELQNGDAAPSYVAGTQNFYAITRYNWSSYYAMAVIELGEAVAADRAQRALSVALRPARGLDPERVEGIRGSRDHRRRRAQRSAVSRRPRRCRRGTVIAQPDLQPLVQLRVAGQSFAHLEPTPQFPARVDPARALGPPRRRSTAARRGCAARIRGARRARRRGCAIEVEAAIARSLRVVRWDTVCASRVRETIPPMGERRRGAPRGIPQVEGLPSGGVI